MPARSFPYTITKLLNYHLSPSATSFSPGSSFFFLIHGINTCIRSFHRAGKALAPLYTTHFPLFCIIFKVHVTSFWPGLPRVVWFHSCSLTLLYSVCVRVCHCAGVRVIVVAFASARVVPGCVAIWAGAFRKV